MANNVVFDRYRLSHLPLRRVDSSIDVQKLASLLKGSKRILLKIASMFPFDFFPDEITIDEYKVNVVSHEFFFSEDIHSITIEMIKDIEVAAGPFFATLKIVPDGYPGNPLVIRFLKKGEAIRAQRIIQGLMVARKQGIDPAKLDNPDFIESIEALGKTHLS